MSLDARGPGARPSETLESTPSETALRRALARARDGKPLDHGEAATLLHARGDDLDRLLSYASRTRDAGLTAAGRPGVITYSRKVFIPLTRLCRDRCAYCTFVTVPRRVTAPFLSPDDVLAIAHRSGARKPSSPSVIVRRRAGRRRGSGWTPMATMTRCPTSARWRSACWRRRGCYPT